MDNKVLGGNLRIQVIKIKGSITENVNLVNPGIDQNIGDQLQIANHSGMGGAGLINKLLAGGRRYTILELQVMLLLAGSQWEVKGGIRETGCGREIRCPALQPALLATNPLNLSLSFSHSNITRNYINVADNNCNQLTDGDDYASTVHKNNLSMLNSSVNDSESDREDVSPSLSPVPQLDGNM